MRVRALVVLTLGLTMAGGSVGLTHAWLRDRQRDSGEAQAAVPKAELVDIVVARADIPFGHELAGDLVRLQPWPKEALPAGAFTSLEELLGGTGAQARRARRIIAAGEPIIATKVSDFGDKVTIADVIDPTKRAVAIQVNDVTGVAGFITPGDKVDIVLTRQLEDRDLRADTILQSITVRGVDQVADEDRDKPAVVRTVTVEVGPEEAQKLALAQQAGTLSLVLRNLSADQMVKIPTMRTSDLAPEKAAAPAPAPAKAAAPVRAPAPPPQVRVVRGGERSTVAVPR
jgi:pilus assembly protein CpaB